MIQNHAIWVLSLLTALLVLMFARGVLLLWRGSRHPVALLAGCLRLTALIVLAFLLHTAFLDYREERSPRKGDSQPPRLLVLHDRSLSMEYAAGNGKSRRQTAEDLQLQLDHLIGSAEPPPNVQHLLFAGNLVPEADEKSLQTHSTNLNRALSMALSRFRSDRILVISDGAGSDGLPPAYLRDWMANRRLELAAICTVERDANLFDARLLSIDSLPLNPQHAEVTVDSYGESVPQVMVELRVDGRPVSTQAVVSGSRQRLSFRLPETANGWHVAEARIVPVAGEVTTRNNRQLAVYRVTPPNRLLFVYSRPRRENLHLVRTLQAEYGDRISVLQAGSAELAAVNLASCRLVVLSETDPSQLPLPLRRAISSRELPVMLLGTGSLSSWIGQLDELPVENLLGELDMTDRFGTPAGIAVASGNRLPAFHSLDFSALELNLVGLARLRSGTMTLFEAQVGQQRYPLVAADDPAAPARLVMLGDTTWKWAMHPEAAVRYQYRLFWNVLFAWLLGEQGERQPLLLETIESDDPEVAAIIRVQPRDLAALAGLQETSLEITIGEETRTLPLTRDGDAFTYDLPLPDELPAAIYLQAHAIHRGDAWRSERRPIVASGDGAEILDTAPQPDILRALAGEPKRFAFAGEAAPVLRAMIRPLDIDLPRPPVRQRNRQRELLLAVIAFLVVALEWTIERRLHEEPAR